MMKMSKVEVEFRGGRKEAMDTIDTSKAVNLKELKIPKSFEVYYPVEYSINKSIGMFADELSFKHKYKEKLLQDRKYKKVFEIENTVEPGMPDLLVIDQDDYAFFIELKYARNGIITFKKTQPPWYKRNYDIPIFITAYDDRTTDIHTFSVRYLLETTTGRTLKLQKVAKL